MSITVELLERMMVSEVDNLHLRIDQLSEIVYRLEDALSAINKNIILLFDAVAEIKDEMRRDYLKKDDAAKLFLTKAEARELFLTKEEARELFLTKEEAKELFLTKQEAKELFLTKAEARDVIREVVVEEVGKLFQQYFGNPARA